jgi:transcription elongation factor Elf1
MYTEIKYLNLLSIRLDKFKQRKDYLWNFRCPLCGDSQRNKNKARGFVFQVKGNLRYKCHNCGASHTFEKFLENQDPVLYKQYRLEKFEDSGKSQKNQANLRKVKSATKAFQERMNDFQFEVLKPNILSDLERIDSLNKSHPAREYLLNRRLPTEALYYTEKFQEWVNSVKPDTFPSSNKDEPRIIIPFISKEGDVFGFQGRSLCSDGLRYITILLDEEAPKIFGLNTINYDKRIYITEGPFDSLLIGNAVAMAGADVRADVLDGCDLVYVYDNEPRNKEICRRIKSHIERGDSVVIWPSVLKQKDINDMVLAGIDVEDVIRSNTFSELTATLKLKDWTKV